MNCRFQAAYRTVASLLLLTLTTLLPTAAALATDDPEQWRYCLPAPRISTPPAPPSDDNTHFTADRAEGEENRYRLTGNVLGQRGAESLSADQITYDVTAGAAQAKGNVRYLSGDRLLLSSQANIVMGSETVARKSCAGSTNRRARCYLNWSGSTERRRRTS